MGDELKPGDIINPSAEHMAYNKRNGLPKYRAQEVVAVLKPGERACDYGYHEPIVGYLNDGEHRVLVNNQVGSRLDRDRFFWPLNHDAPDPKPSPDAYTPVRYTKTTICPQPCLTLC